MLVFVWTVTTGLNGLSGEELRWKLQPGQQYRMFVERTVRQNSPLVQWVEETRYQLLWAVTGVDTSGNMEIVQTVGEVKHSMRWGEADPIEFDSMAGQEAKGDAVNLARHWKPLLSTERKFRLTPRGQFLAAAASPAPTPSTTGNSSSVSGPSSDTSSSSSGVPTTSLTTNPTASTPFLTAPPTTTGSAATPVSSTLPTALRPVYWVLPAESVQVGFQWTDTQSLPLLDRQDAWQVTTAYTYQGHQLLEDRELDRIQVETRWKTAPGSSTPAALTLERQNGTGVIWFDHEDGYLASSQMNQELITRSRRPDGTTFQSEITTTVRVRMEPIRTVPVDDDPVESVEKAEAPVPTPSRSGAGQPSGQ